MKIADSKTAAWMGFSLIIALAVLTFGLREAWWCFIDLFFLFMMAFLHVVALSIRKYNSIASRQLDSISGICGIFGVVALIAELIVWQAAFS